MAMNKIPTLKSTIKSCQDFNFNEDITKETIWNTAYNLGRSRWFWGPAWLVTVRGFLTTCLLNTFHFLCGVLGGHRYINSVCACCGKIKPLPYHLKPLTFIKEL